MRHNKYLTGIFIAISCSCLSVSVIAQSRGYMQDEAIKVPGVINEGQVITLAATSKITTRSYTDGLGRTIQTVGLQASPTQKDIIQPVAYDNLGDVLTQYLPYTITNTGAYRTNALGPGSEQSAFYTSATKVAHDASPYAGQLFETSPLKRLLRSGTVGIGFQTATGQHYKSATYRTNTAADNVIIWNTSGTNTGYYTAGQLSVTDGINEDGVETLSFQNNEGQVVLKRELAQVSPQTYLETYYIYNEAGNIMYILQPKAIALMKASNVWNLTQTDISKLLFNYVYDNQGRVIQKTVSGGASMFIVYDPLNRPVLFQDNNLRTGNNWNYVKYDIKGRVISQGIYNDTSHIGLAAMQTYVSGLDYSIAYFEDRSTTSGTGYYTNNIFPSSGITPLGYNYFDDYNINNDASNIDDYIWSSGISGDSTATMHTKGMLTAVSTRTIGQGLSNVWLTKVMFYDRNGRAIQVLSNNHLNSTVNNVQTTLADFTGHPLQTKTVQIASGITTSVLTTYNYDYMYRVTAIDQAYNGATTIRVANYEFNELGQVVKKNLKQMGVGTYLQGVDYRFNIRGQLTSINNSKLANDGGDTNTDTNDLFGMQIMYDAPDVNISGASASYSGRVSAVKWMTKDALGANTNERSYKYTYDQLNRLTASTYAERTSASTSAFNINQNGFDESGITYDENGNILTLQRNSSTLNASSNTQVDNLTYTYNTANPNQLQKVTDGTGSNYTGYGFKNVTGSTSDYSYSADGSGNLTTDPYKALALSYNVLNKTDQITLTAGTNNFITYTYDATGQLLRKQQFNNNVLQNTTDYINGFVYLNNALSYFNMPEGRVLNLSGTLQPEYVITDQQGNARLSFTDNGSGTAVIRQENSYYAYGLTFANGPVTPPNSLNIPNNNLYNGGAEWQNDFNTLPDYYQTFYRNYDAALGRFVSADPMPEASESLGCYHYAGNNPVMYNDPMGDYRPNAAPNDPFNGSTFNNGNNRDFVHKQGDKQMQFAQDLQEAQASPEGLAEYASKYGEPVDFHGANVHDIISGKLNSNGTFTFNTSNNSYVYDAELGRKIVVISYEKHTINLNDNNTNQGREIPGWRVPVINPIVPGATFSVPINGGAASESISGEAAVGYVLTRYGGTRPNSEYFSPRGVTIGQRNLLKGTNTDIYEEFEVLKPFSFKQTQIAGQDGLPTGGIQLQSSMPAGQLLNEGYIGPVETPGVPIELPEFFMFP